MIPIKIVVRSLAGSKGVVMDTKLVFLVSKNIVYIIKAVTEYDDKNDDPDERDKDEEEDYSDDYSDDPDKEEERKKDDRNAEEL